MQRFLSRFFAISALCGVKAAYDNFPVKSIGLDKAPGVNFYKATSLEEYGAFDAHAVHGSVLSDGSYVITGKALASEGSSTKKAFAAKLTSGGEISWVWSSSSTSAANAVLQLPGGGDLLVFGWRSVGGTYKRSISKITLAEGSETWTATWDSANGGHGAWEMGEITKDGKSILLAGLHNAGSNEEFNFKSYGNVVNGEAIVQSLPVSACGETAPAASAASWTYTATVYWTAKAARSLKDGSAVALLFHGDPGFMKQATLVKISSTGKAVWGPTNYGADGITGHGEGTDVVVSQDETSFYICGHGPGQNAGTLSGRITKITDGAAAGTKAWSKSYSSIDYKQSGNPSLIKNECWGIQALSNGLVMGCGTGIEDCEGYSGTKLSDCEAGTADSREGAVARKKSVWQSMIVKTDLDGNLQWQRVDQYREEGTPALGQSGWEALSSASEYVLVNSDGTFVSVNDEANGVGLLKLGGESSATAGAAPTAPGTLEEEPCFPSSATVTLANGISMRIDSLKEGDSILAATADGSITTGSVSLFSAAKPDAEATFLTLTTSSNLKLTITPEHHLPVGEACCSNLKKAKDVAIGDTVWAVSPTAVEAHTVASKGLTIDKGLHSPVLTNGAMPVVDGMATAFDSMWIVKLASYALPYALPLCKATGTCSFLRRAAALYSGKEIKYIDGLDLAAAQATNSAASLSAVPLASLASCAK